MTPIAITHHTLTTALGAGRHAHLAALAEGRSGLAPCHFADVELPGWVGEIAGLDALAWPAAWSDWDCRNNRLAWLATQQDGFEASVRAAVERWGARRVAVVLGTSTSGILQTELAYRRRDAQGRMPADFHYDKTHSTHSVAAFMAQALGIAGPNWVVSTACSSSAKAFGAGARLLDAGWVDAVLVGGVDSLCQTTLYGFHSLELFSPEICRPWDAGRRGLSIGEGAAFALLEREAPAAQGLLLGVGESNDGYHMSSPRPDGAGAMAAMRQALASAGLQARDIDYINLHGTATPNNDVAEDTSVCGVFGRATPASSTKGATGHTLGAAGAVEASISLLVIESGLMPGGLNLREIDPALHVQYLTASRRGRVHRVLSNSFGFGGSNACLVLGAAA